MVLKYFRKRVKAAISAEKTTTLKTRAVTKEEVDAEWASFWMLSVLFVDL